MISRLKCISGGRIAAVIGALAVSAFADSQMSAAELELVKDGKPQVVLVLPEKPAEDETLAANEIAEYVKKISGAEIQKVTENNIPQGLLPVKIGLPLCADAEKEIKAKGDDPGAFMLDVRKDGVCLAGLSPEGTLFAAYELLEQLGVGWYMPGENGTVVPSSKNVSLRLQQTIQVPSFTGRHLQAIGDQQWARRMRLGGMDGGAHGLPFKADRKANPEFFCHEDGKPTHQLEVSNPEVLKRTVEATLNFFRKYPNKKYISMSPDDGDGFGVSPWDANDIDPLHGKISTTDRYIKFFNLVLNEVHKEFPNAGIAFYCYGQLMRPPVREIPDKNLLVIFAPIDLCRFHSINNPVCPERAYMKEVIDGWQKLGCRMFYRGYYFNLADQGFPFTMMRQISDEIPFFLDSGFIGCRVECMPLWGHHGPSLYLASRLMWDAKADSKKIMDGYFKSFYGPAAKPMQGFFDALEDAFENADHHTGNVFDMPHILIPEVMKRLDGYLDDAEKLAGADSEYAKRVKLVRTAQEYGKANLSMIAAFNACDLKKANEDYKRAAAIIAEGNKMSPPLFHRGPAGYLERFWGKSIKAAAEKLEKGNRIIAKLPDQWFFILDPLDGGESLGFYKPGMGTNNWLPMKTYSESWSNQGLRYYKGDAWYRTSIKIGDEFKGQNVNLWLGGIDDKAFVWINGEKLECVEKGAAPIGRAWEFDASKAIRFGQDNIIVVKVSNRAVNELGTGGITGPAMFWTVPQTGAGK